MDESHVIRHYNTLVRIHQDQKYWGREPPVDLEPPFDNYWLWGEVGKGKSFWVKTNYPGAWTPSRKTDWWDSYSFEETIHLEELDPTEDRAWFKWLKQISDLYVLEVPIRNRGDIKIRPKRVVVSSNYSPADFLNTCREKDVDAIVRRFKIIKF